MLKTFKRALTVLGARLSSDAVIRVQATANYIRIGQWMAERGFSFPNRLPSRESVWAAVADRVSDQPVLYLEFGVFEGAATKFWASRLHHPETRLHGFDSFEGMPEQGGAWTKGEFDVGGRIPSIDDPRVQFFRGWFDQVLPRYTVPPHEALVINLDADLYSSTSYVLQFLKPLIKPGTLLYFDEFNHVDHEPRAFDELIRGTKLTFEPLAADETLAHVAFRCVS